MNRLEEQRRIRDLEREQERIEAEDADRLLNPYLYGMESLHRVGSWDFYSGDARRDKGEC